MIDKGKDIKKEPNVIASEIAFKAFKGFTDEIVGLTNEECAFVALELASTLTAMLLLPIFQETNALGVKSLKESLSTLTDVKLTHYQEAIIKTEKKSLIIH